MTNELSGRKHHWSILGGISILTLLCVSVFDDPLILDEAIFAQTMRALAETGEFRYYAGVTRGWQQGLWHPPTYIAYVAAWFRAFGASSVVGRAATTLFSLLTVPALALLATRLARRPSATGADERVVVAGAIALYITSPLVVQNATLVDIDGSILALVVTLFVAWTVAVLERDESDGRLYAGTGVWFAGIAWVKFGVLPVLLVCLVGYVVLRRGLRRSVGVGVAAVLGIGIFVASWWAVAWLFGLDFVAPFAHNFGSLLDGGSSIGTQKRLLLSAWSAYLELLWLSPFLAALTALAVVDGRVSLVDRKALLDRAPMLFPVFISLLTLVQYALLAKTPYGFPKYLGIAMPLLCAVAATQIPTALDAIDSRERRWTVVLIGVAAGTVIAFGDPFLVSFNDGYRAVVFQSATTLAGLVVAMLVVGSVLVSRLRPLDRRALVVVGLLVLLVGTNVGILAIQVSADYSTRYNYGQQGTETAIAETRTAYASVPTSERSDVVLPRDFAFYVDGEFHIVREYSVDELHQEQPPLVVMRTRKYYAVDSPLLDTLRSTESYTATEYGSYILFRHTETPIESRRTDDGHVRVSPQIFTR